VQDRRSKTTDEKKDCASLVRLDQGSAPFKIRTSRDSGQTAHFDGVIVSTKESIVNVRGRDQMPPTSEDDPRVGMVHLP